MKFFIPIIIEIILITLNNIFWNKLKKNLPFNSKKAQFYYLCQVFFIFLIGASTVFYYILIIHLHICGESCLYGSEW